MLLAPLAGIGNWFVRLQAKRHGAGMAVWRWSRASRSTTATRRRCTELLRIHPDERSGARRDPALRPGPGGHALGRRDGRRGAAPTSSTSTWAARCPRSARPAPAPRCSTTPTRAVAVARAAREGCGLPVTVKLRSGPASRATPSGFDLAHRLVDEAGVAAITFHPRSASVHHKGSPDYDLAARLVGVAGRAGDPHRRPALGAEVARRPRAHRAPPR